MCFYVVGFAGQKQLVISCSSDANEACIRRACSFVLCDVCGVGVVVVLLVRKSDRNSTGVRVPQSLHSTGST